MLPIEDAALVTWSSYGCFIVDYKRNAPPESSIIYLEVPKSSDFTDVNGIPMCGNHLAKRFKTVAATTFGIPEDLLKVKYRESDVHWDQFMADFAKKYATSRLGYPESYTNTWGVAQG